MPREHHAARHFPANGTSPEPAGDYWHALIDEKTAGEFLGLTARSMQAMRQRGGGPRYMALSSRCLRYTRAWLREWAEQRVRCSTSDDGQGAA